jgi:hypothetical protein
MHYEEYNGEMFIVAWLPEPVAENAYEALEAEGLTPVGLRRSGRVDVRDQNVPVAIGVPHSQVDQAGEILTTAGFYDTPDNFPLLAHVLRQTAAVVLSVILALVVMRLVPGRIEGSSVMTFAVLFVGGFVLAQFFWPIPKTPTAPWDASNSEWERSLPDDQER